MANDTFYRSIEVDNVPIFYREAGKPGSPVLLLLHGFPSSSHMYRNLINDLSGNYHLYAPDYPGFGQSGAPEVEAFDYTFENLSVIMEHFIDHLELKNIHLYIQDYGGPIGLRIANRRPELISSIIVQNANAYLEGLGTILQPLVAYLENPTTETEKGARYFLTLEATKFQYMNGANDTEKIAPDSYIVDQYHLDRQGNDIIQLALFRDYGSNIAKYDEWQKYFREYKPKMLVVWGKNDSMFIEAGGSAYKKDLPDAEIIQINGGHFLLEEHHRDVAILIHRFIQKI